MSPTELHQQLDRIWGARPGLGCLAVVNHNNIGRRFIVTGLLFFLIGGLLAMLMRTQLAFPGNDFVDQNTYNQLFTLHGTTMMFLFAVPIIEGFAIYLVPKLIGTRDLIFPRLTAYGYWCYLFGGLLLYSSLLLGDAPDGGWFMYTPLTGPTYSPGKGADFWLMGVTLAEVSAVAAAVELVVAILITRAPGMRLRYMPIFAWAMLVVAVMILFAFPPLILGSVLLELERAFQLPFFNVSLGGDPLLWQHLFWLFGHPEVYIIFLPGAAILSTIIPVFAGRPLASYAWVVVALVATGFISFGLWVHHMYAVGIPHLALSFFAAASMAVAIPTGIQVFTWIATLWPSRPRLTVPMLYIYGFFFIFVLGGLTGVMVALVPFDLQVHDTHFVVAHLHYVLIGGLVFPVFAALYYWLPHFGGRMPSERLGRGGFWLIFIGFNLTFLVMHLTGLLGMPRRIYLYPDGVGWHWPNLVSSVGGFLFAVGVAALLLDVLLHFFHGRRVRPNPWRADTLDWAMPLPPPSYNFASIPPVDHINPLWRNPELGAEQETGAHYLGHPEPRRREILGTSPVQAEPEQVIVLPGNTWSPLVLAVFTALVFIGVLVGWYWLSLASLAAVLVSAGCWAMAGEPLPDSLPAGHGKTLPLHPKHPWRPGLCGLLTALVPAGAVAATLLFAYFYYWTVTPGWPPDPLYAPAPAPALALLVLLLSSAFSLRQGTRSGRRGWVLLAALLLLVATLALWWLWGAAGLSPARQAYDALVTVVLGWVSLWSAGALVVAAVILARRGGPEQSEWRVARTYWYYTTGQGLLLLTPLSFFPRIL